MEYKKYRWHQYFWKQVNSALGFIIPQNQKILFVGDYYYDFLKSVKPAVLDVISTDIANFKPQRIYDYIIVFGALGTTNNICDLLGNLRSGLSSTSRLIIYQHNYLWMPLLKLGSWLKIKNRELNQNWLSINDVKSYLSAFGYETVKTWKKTLLPVNFLFLGNLFNFIGIVLPFFDWLKINQFIVARSIVEPILINNNQSLTICITVRNEKENIEPIVKKLPLITKQQEILFVEGHSTDGTFEEVERVKILYPEKNVRVIKQPGIGQGDAIRVGFKDAKGDIVVLYEGDGTSDPKDIFYFYEAIATGRFEFIEGTRFVYPLNNKSMPFINQVGNMFFAGWFSWFLKTYLTDVLSGIKAVGRQNYQNIYDNWGCLNLNDPFGDFELLYGAARYNLKFGEVPMKYYPRNYGQTKTKVFQHGFKLLMLVLKGYVIFRKLKPN